MNYAKHTTEELKASLTKEPVIFLKPDTALLKDEKDFYLPDFSNRVEYETEVVFRINKMGKCIDPRFAMRYVDGVSLGIDVTARDIQADARAKGLPWDLSKGFDGSAILGDVLDIAEVPTASSDLEFSLEIDGKEVQRGNTRDMLFPVEQIISYISRYYTFKTGDLIYTGTPVGVGRLAIGQHLEGFLRVNGQKRKVLECNIK